MQLPGEAVLAVQEVPTRLLRLRTGAILPSEGVLARRLVRQLAGGRREPVIVRRANGGFEVIAGDVEYLLARRRGEDTMSVIVRDVDDEGAITLRLSEESRRGDLNVLEASKLLEELVGEYGLTQQEVAVKCGWTQSTVANKLRLLRLPKEVLEAIECGSVGERTARALLMVDDDSQKIGILRKAMKMGLSASEVEEMCRGLAGERSISRSRKSREKRVFKDIRIFQNSLRKIVSEMRKAGLDLSLSEENRDEVWEFKVTVRL